MTDFVFDPNHTCYMAVDWREAQNIARRHRRKGLRVHVCQLNKQLHVLWAEQQVARSQSSR